MTSRGPKSAGTWTIVSFSSRFKCFPIKCSIDLERQVFFQSPDETEVQQEKSAA